METRFHLRTVTGEDGKVVVLCADRTRYSECIQESYSTIYVCVGSQSAVMAAYAAGCDGQLLGCPTGFGEIATP